MRRIALLLWALAVHSPAWGGVLDFLKTPAGLIMNQKNCTAVMRGNTLTGAVENGRFFHLAADGEMGTILSMSQLNGNRVTASIERGARHEILVAEVERGGGVVTATYTNGSIARILVECRL